MAVVTLTGERLAKEGAEFVFLGPQPGCKDCKLKGPCLHLVVGQRYLIQGVRPIHHDDICKYHEDGVRVVEVKAVPLETSLRSPRAIEGSMVAFEFLDCRNLACQNYRLCHPYGLDERSRVKVLEVGEPLVCPVGFRIRRVKVQGPG
jgi:uncharacterized protein (UPF0179 family)